jgi:hypothetical protein
MFGEILLRSGIASAVQLADAMAVLAAGGLRHSNIGACALFGSVSGSSVATAATIGVVAMGEIEKHKYNEPLFLGTLAGRRDAWDPHPALDQHDHLRRDDDTSVPEAVSLRIPSGLYSHRAVQPDGAVACIWRPHWGGNKIETSWDERIPDLPDLLPSRSFCWRSSSARSSTGSRPPPKPPPWASSVRLRSRRGAAVDFGHAARCLRGDGAHDRDGGGDPGRRFFLNVVIQTIGLTQQLSR